MHERTWQFRLTDENVIDCAAYFSERASEVAAAINCQVVASNVVKIEKLHGNVRKVIGNALLINVIEFPRDRKRRSSSLG